MKKLLLSTLIASSLIGCANTNIEEEKKEEETIKITKTEDMFYNAFLGELMETEGQNNNAIKHYEKIISQQYDVKYFNKLMQLYFYKKDVVSAKNLILSTDIDTLSENHNELLFVYYLSKNKINNAVDFFSETFKEQKEYKSLTLTEDNHFYLLFSNQLETLFSENEKKKKLLNELKKHDLNQYDFLNEKKNKESLIKENNRAYLLFSNQLKFFFNEDETQKEFLKKLKENNLSQYNLLNATMNQTPPKKLNIDDFDGIDKEIVKLNKVISYDDFEFMKDTLLFEHLQIDIKKEILNKYAFYYLRKKEFEKIKELYAFTEQNNNSLTTDNLKVFESLYYFYNFQNKDALYKLDKIKNLINKDAYYTRKAVLNFMLGYKTAARKYFNNVDNPAYFSEYINIYISLFGEDGFDRFKEFTNGQKKLLLAEYYIQKGQEKKAINKYNEGIEILNETGEEEELLELFKSQKIKITNPEKGLDNLYKKGVNESDILYLNDYIYMSLKKNINSENIDSIIKKYEKELNGNSALVDTLAYYYLKRGNGRKAIEIYTTHKLLTSHNPEIQKNISASYKNIGDLNKYEIHKKRSEMLMGY